MRIIRVEKTNSLDFQGYNKQPFVIFLDDPHLEKGDKIRPYGLKPAEGQLPSSQGYKQRVNAPERELEVIERLLDDDWGVYRYWVKHLHPSTEYSWPDEFLLKGVKYEVLDREILTPKVEVVNKAVEEVIVPVKEEPVPVVGEVPAAEEPTNVGITEEELLIGIGNTPEEADGIS